MKNPDELQTLAAREKERLWRFTFRYPGSELPPALTGFRKHELNALLFLSIGQPVELCKFLNTHLFTLENMMNHPSYRSFRIARKNGPAREILAPDKPLKILQKRLNYFLQGYYLCVKPKEVHGFVVNPHYLGRSCNIVANAHQHVGKRFLLNIDLKDFFPGIAARQVRDLFRSELFRFSDQIANALTLLTTYKGNLPVGAPTSPVISNFICYPLDHDLIEFCGKHGLTYSRYADDMTFSSDIPISEAIFEGIRETVELHGFKINNRKVRLAGPNRRKSVTGITVNEKVNVDRRLLKKVRAMAHDLAVNGKEVAATRHFDLSREAGPEFQEKFMNRFTGYINFIGQVRGTNDNFYKKYREMVMTSS
jgi:RNA-directed DNA polymerase